MRTQASKDDEAAFSDLFVAEQEKARTVLNVANLTKVSALSSRFCTVEVLVGLVNLKSTIQ